MSLAWVVLLSQTWEISHMMIYIISNEMYSFSRTEAFLSQFLKIQDEKGWGKMARAITMNPK